MASSDKRDRFVEAVANYVEGHERYNDLTKREAVLEAVRVLTGDIGAAQEFLNVLGVDVDLYA